MNQQLRRLIPITFLAVSCGLLPLPAQTSYPAGVNGSPNSTVLVELFTSEGCSSCPPADTLLRQINGTKTVAGQLIVGISEHVSYWNGLGWSDPYSSEIYTARQNAYGNRFRLDGVYTPQMVINGSEQIVGSDRNALQRALQHENSRPQMPLHILSATIAGRVLNLSFSAGGAPVGQRVEIMAVFTDDFDQSNVGRGENSGRTLAHVSVARSLARIAFVDRSVEKTMQLPLPASFDSGKSGHHLILFAQASGLGPVLGTDSKPI
jgi:hypothetical protein